MPMNDTIYEVKKTTRFKKDYRLAKKRGADIPLLREIIVKLANNEPLPEKNRDHALVGDWQGYRECHITSDWLLVYRKDEDILVLTLMRTGSHSDLVF
jgi:mRNA interferase YafQ